MTYDPLKIIERPKMGMFTGLPSAAPGTVLVIDREGHPVRVLAGPGDRLTAGEVRWGQIRTLYEVDVTEHPLEFRDAFPCKDDIGGFRATVNLACRVADSAAVVIRGIHDAARVLLPPVTETLRRVCGGFAAEDYQEAEKAGLAAIRSLEAGPGHDRAFRISQIHLVLVLDDAAAAYVRERKEATRNLVRQEDAALLDKEKAKLEAELARARDQLEAERERAASEFEQERLLMQRTRDRLEGQLEDQRQELELARAAARARAEHKGATEIELERLEFEVIRQQKQAELDARKLELDLERARLQAEYDKRVLEAKLERDRIQINQLTELLDRGQFAALAMQLAQDPGAIGPVITHLADQRATDINRQLQALRLLVENDGLEGWQITEQAKTVLHQLIATWTEHSGQALPDAGTPSEIEAPHQAEMPADLTGSGADRQETSAADDDEFPGDRDAPDTSSPAPPAGLWETRD
jgi:hypothetical protein